LRSGTPSGLQWGPSPTRSKRFRCDRCGWQRGSHGRRGSEL